jgi:uncharacterized protein YjdB
MWAWCDIREMDVDQYLADMEMLIARYGPGGTEERENPVTFVFMNAHTYPYVDYGEEVYNSNMQIREYCEEHDHWFYDFYDLECFDPDENYFGDGTPERGPWNGDKRLRWDMSYDLEEGGRGNWGIEWMNANPGTELTELSADDICTHCAHSNGEGGDNNSRLHCVLKGQAAWWLWASLAGWQEEIPVSDIQIYATGDTSVLTGQELQLHATILPANATNTEIEWSVIQGSGTATISQQGLLLGEQPGEVQVVCTAQDGSGVADTLLVPVLDPTVPVSSISISTAGSASEMYVGETLQCFASVLPAEASNPSVIWSLVNQSGWASITAEGLVNGMEVGSIEVIATAEDGSGVADTIVLEIVPVLVAVERITIASAGDVTEMESGFTLQFSAEVLPADATSPDVIWSVSNRMGSATIDTDGLLTAGDPGTVDVFASAVDGSEVADTFALEIVPRTILVERISISSDGGASEVESGMALQFTAEVLPVDATNTEVSWSVINGTGTATISTNGLLVAGSPGQVEVLASAQDGSGAADTFLLDIVPEALLVESIAVISTGGVSSLESGSTLQFITEVLPADATNPEVTWSVSNETGTARVSATGLLTAGNPGTVAAVATAVDGSGISGNFSLQITAPPIMVENISIVSDGNISTLESGSTLQFTTEVLPADATNPEVSWSVQNETGTASISAGGLLTAGNPGTIRVEATALDGSGISDSFSLTIIAPPVPVTYIAILADGGVIESESGQTLQFYADIFPDEASNKNLQWSINNISGTASISQQGLLYGGDPGVVEVVATSRDGSGVSASFLLTIVPGVIDVTSIEVSSEGGVTVVEEGDMLQLYAAVLPTNANNREVYWHMSSTGGNPVGSITGDGLFIALGEGEVDALAIARDGSGVYDALRLIVLPVISGEENQKQEDLILYPNPGTGLFYLQVGELKSKILRVIDVRGDLVLEMNPEPGLSIIELDLGRQKPGIYFVQLITEGSCIVKPILITR